jgi:hypothetical protein
MRLGLNALTFECLLAFGRTAEFFVIEGRPTRLSFGRFAGERRACAFRFECLAKIAVKGFKAPLSRPNPAF